MKTMSEIIIDEPMHFVSGAERLNYGRSLRETCVWDMQGEWTVHKDRDLNIDRIFWQEKNRIPELIPLRHKRMAESPFRFYRGAAIIMAEDLASTVQTGIIVQACGDAHISNFGMFRSPERNLIFDINDFDETFPGSWEVDLKRLLTSVELCGRDRGLLEEHRKEAVLAGARVYRESMEILSRMTGIDVWYSQLQIESLFLKYKDKFDKEDAQLISKAIAKAHSKNHEKAVAKLTELKDGRRQFIYDPPLVIPLKKLDLPSINPGETEKAIKRFLIQYRQSLPMERRTLFNQYKILDIAAKVVGVGSVGTRCWIVLLEGQQEQDYLILQLKEATRSVLDLHSKNYGLQSNGQRIVLGQRAIQTVGDILLGWASFDDGNLRYDYYIRQLWDGKGSFDLDKVNPERLAGVAKLCAGVLAHAHAKTGDRHAIAGYLGESEEADKAMARFAVSYADQNEIDYELFRKKACC